MASTLDELKASHDVWIACLVRDSWRSDSRELELAADSSIDADTDARYTGASARSTVGLPEVTLLQPTMTIAMAARLPIARAAIPSRWPDSPPISTVCRRYRFGPSIAGSFQSAPPAVRVGHDGGTI